MTFLGGTSFGSSPAAISAGNITFGTTNTHTVEIGGLVPGGEYDQVNADTLNLGGTLDVRFIDLDNGYVPAAGDSFSILTGDIAATFTAQTLPPLPEDLVWEVIYASDAVRLEIERIPDVESVIINDGLSTSRSQITSLTVNFAGAVNHWALADAFTLTNIDTGIAVGAIAAVANDTGAKTSATLTFSGLSTTPRATGNTLDDGNYRLSIGASAIKTPGGQFAMATDFDFGSQTAGQTNNDDFFRLFGDSDGDGDIDGQDYGRFGLTFLRPSSDAAYNSDLDYDGDGDVDSQDYGHFGQRLLTQRM